MLLVIQMGSHYGLQLSSRQHELHLLGQHGGCSLLLDQVVPAVYLQLGLEMRRRMQVLTVITCTASLRGVEEGDTERERDREMNYTESQLVKDPRLCDRKIRAP